MQYVCMTERGVIRIGADDFWTALEEYEEYVTADGQSRDSPPLQIVASAGSVVHVGGSVGSSFGTVASAESAVLTQSSSWDFGALAAEIKTLRETVPADLPDRDNQIYVGALAEAEVAAEAHRSGVDHWAVLAKPIGHSLPLSEISVHFAVCLFRAAWAHLRNAAIAQPRQDILDLATNTVTWARQFPRPRGPENCHYPVSQCRTTRKPSSWSS